MLPGSVLPILFVALIFVGFFCGTETAKSVSAGKGGSKGGRNSPTGSREGRRQSTCNCQNSGHKPVCGRDMITYPNRCEAQCRRIIIAKEGKCKTYRKTN